MHYVLIFFTIPVLILVAIAQYINWRNKRDGNGADRARLAMMAGSVSAIGVCVSSLLEWFDGVAFFVSIVPFVGMSLYWRIFKEQVLNAYHSILRR